MDLIAMTIMGVSGTANEVLDYLPVGGAIGGLVFILKMGWRFQTDFADRYHLRIKEQDGIISTLEAELELTRLARDECCRKEEQLTWKNGILVGLLTSHNVPVPEYLKDGRAIQ